jgi:hypothetical protein
MVATPAPRGFNPFIFAVIARATIGCHHLNRLRAGQLRRHRKIAPRSSVVTPRGRSHSAPLA